MPAILAGDIFYVELEQLNPIIAVNRISIAHTKNLTIRVLCKTR
ncbi:hypothetical protein F0Z19_1055 [Vibrio cyclitrophicus]|nr:hypothetical protein F0Z19_1055 [Vibrio cyclitrophicus]